MSERVYTESFPPFLLDIDARVDLDLYKKGLMHEDTRDPAVRAAMRPIMFDANSELMPYVGSKVHLDSKLLFAPNASESHMVGRKALPNQDVIGKISFFVISSLKYNQTGEQRNSLYLLLNASTHENAWLDLDGMVLTSIKNARTIVFGVEEQAN